MDHTHAAELLVRERARVEKAIADLDPDDDELESGLLESLRNDLLAIERAEERLEQGSYGLSVESGEPIPDARLEVIPWAERTVDEEARLA